MVKHSFDAEMMSTTKRNVDGFDACWLGINGVYLSIVDVDCFCSVAVVFPAKLLTCFLIILFVIKLVLSL